MCLEIGEKKQKSKKVVTENGLQNGTQSSDTESSGIPSKSKKRTALLREKVDTDKESNSVSDSNSGKSRSRNKKTSALLQEKIEDDIDSDSDMVISKKE